jgi:hypothetical protein
MCCVHRQNCKCFYVHQTGDDEFRVRFVDGSLVGTFCERRLAMVVAWLLNRHHSFDTLLYCVSEVLRRVKLIEDCEQQRFVWHLAYDACNGDAARAEEITRKVMLKLQERREKENIYG